MKTNKNLFEEKAFRNHSIATEIPIHVGRDTTASNLSTGPVHSKNK